MIGLVSQDPKTYARRIVPLLVTPDLESPSGALFDSKGRAILPTAGLTEDHTSAFLSASEDLVSRAGAA